MVELSAMSMWRRPTCGAPRRLTFNSNFVILAIFLTVLLGSANADCECGYATTMGDNDEQYVFTDLLETDFTRLESLSANTDWMGQTWNKSSQSARGEFGETFSKQNLVVNPSRNDHGRGGYGNGDDNQTAGLNLVVKSKVTDGLVPGAELDSARNDILWGSFRTGLKLTANPGTCAAFFWYYNDTQEIDMEFLSQDFDPSNNSFPVNLVLQSSESAEAGYNAQKTGNFKKVYLPFDPTQDVHEYRMDFLPERVVFYADGQPLAEMTGASVPDHPGHLILQHWSNGNPLWSGGPPTRDSSLTVAYVRAYFNSSSEGRRRDWEGRCHNAAAPGAVCQIPTRMNVGNLAFFSSAANMTNNQTISTGGFESSKSPAAPATTPRSLWLVIVASLLYMGFLSGLW